MRLYIDTSDNRKTVVGLDKDRLEKPTGVDKSQQVLTLISEILKKNKKTLKDITEIKVETGPGSFTGLRVGVAVANALAWALKVSVNNQKIGKLVEPKYK
ncbi:MAG: hypothetical protein ACOZBZ_01290 [Patescibacteria group bacterium]